MLNVICVIEAIVIVVLAVWLWIATGWLVGYQEEARIERENAKVWWQRSNRAEGMLVRIRAVLGEKDGRDA